MLPAQTSSPLLRGLCALRALCVKFFSTVVPFAALLFIALVTAAPAPQSSAPRSFLGFDRNIYPGDDALPILRKVFSFASYWLSPPPGEKTNTWSGKREALRSQGFGFLVLFRGPQVSELQKIWSESRFNRADRLQAQAEKRGTSDASLAAATAKKEGFPLRTVIFLDIEEGGRLPVVYHVYLHSWSEELKRAGFVPGVYCSGIPLKEGPGVAITTAGDISDHAPSHEIVIWAFNDVCPPSPGCAFPGNPPAPSASGISYAAVWQFAQSPRRKERTARCPAKYAPDGNCYAPGDIAHKWFLDVDTATSADPSGGLK